MQTMLVHIYYCISTTDFTDFDRPVGTTAYSWSQGPDPSNPLSAPVEDFQKDLATNTASAYAAAQAAIKGFEKLPDNVLKTLIFTGNLGDTCVRSTRGSSRPMFRSLLTPLDHALHLRPRPDQIQRLVHGANPRRHTRPRL